MKPPKLHVEIHGNRAAIVADLRGTVPQPARPERLKCDYCGAPSDRLWGQWIRACTLLPGSMRQVRLPDPCHWWACVYCRPLITAGDLRALTARVMVLIPSIPPTEHKHFQALYEAIQAAASGEVAYWEAGQPWPPTGP